MNLITEYASRPDVAIGLFKMPSSIISVCDVVDATGGGKISLKPRILTFSPIPGNSEEVMVRKYLIGSEELPTLIKEQNIFLKYLFTAEALKPICEGCRMVPYSFDPYPADVVYNDPPQSIVQENSVIKYFQTIQNSLRHQEYRRMVVWCDFITQNASKSFLADYGEPIHTNGLIYVNSENVKRYDKKNWTKWLSWCEKLCLVASTDWANEILFAKCIPRMKKKDMSVMSIPMCEDVENAA